MSPATSAPESIELGTVTLRRWRRGDEEALTRAIEESREHLRPWMTWEVAATLEQRREFVLAREQEWEVGGDLVWGLFAGPLVVGSCGLHRRIGPTGLEIGYWVHAAHTRRGHATASAAALTSVAFTLPDIAVVEIHHDAANLASEGVPRKLGFVPAGEYPKRSPRAPAESGVFRIWRMERDRWRPPPPVPPGS